jgi:hypothetical protein
MILPDGPYSIKCDRKGCKKRTNYARAGWLRVMSLTGTDSRDFCSAECLADWSAAEAAMVGTQPVEEPNLVEEPR